MESPSEASISNVKSFLSQLSQTLQAEQAATADVEAKLKHLCQDNDLDYQVIADRIQSKLKSEVPLPKTRTTQIETETEAAKLRRENDLLLINLQRYDSISDKLERLLGENENILTLVRESVTDIKSNLAKSEDKTDKIYSDRLESFDETIHTLDLKLRQCKVGYDSLERKMDSFAHLHTMYSSDASNQ